MRYAPDRHKRRSIRLPRYDYAGQGSYFITICTAERECLFGQVVDNVVDLSLFGQIAARELKASATIRPTLRLDASVVMPNHIHCLVTLAEGFADQGAPLRAPTGMPALAGRTIGAFVNAYKGMVTRRINALRDTPGTPIWQRNYYEHIVRDDDDFYRIIAYIEDNPRRWHDDEYHPDRPAQPSISHPL